MALFDAFRLHAPLVNGDLLSGVYSSLILYPTLYATAGDVLLCQLTTTGGGYSWDKNGNLSCDCAECEEESKTLSDVIDAALHKHKAQVTKTLQEKYDNESRYLQKTLTSTPEFTYQHKSDAALESLFSYHKMVVHVMEYHYDLFILGLLSADTRATDLTLVSRSFENLWLSGCCPLLTIPDDISEEWRAAVAYIAGLINENIADIKEAERMHVSRMNDRLKELLITPTTDPARLLLLTRHKWTSL